MMIWKLLCNYIVSKTHDCNVYLFSYHEIKWQPKSFLIWYHSLGFWSFQKHFSFASFSRPAALSRLLPPPCPFFALLFLWLLPPKSIPQFWLLILKLVFTFQALLSDLSKPTVTKDFEWQHKIFKHSILLDFVGHKLKYCIFQIKFYI